MTASQARTRSQRGMQLCMQTQKSWTPARIGIVIPSQTIAGRTYVTSTDSCDCPDSMYRNVTCKHQLAARIFMGRNAA